jgi:hypothetical protein
MAPCKAIDASGVASLNSDATKQLLGVITGQIPQREAAEQLAKRARPPRHRRLAAREDDPHIVGDGRNEGLA